MTLEGRSALTEINSALSNIRYALEKLSESALKGPAFEARRLAEFDRDERTLLAAVGEVTDRYREIRARHRSGAGTWYAVVDIFRWGETHSHGEGVDVIWEKCGGKQAAITAARRPPKTTQLNHADVNWRYADGGNAFDLTSPAPLRSPSTAC